MPVEFARLLKYTNPERFHELKLNAYVHYWKKTTPEDEDTQKMLKFIEYVEDESNRMFKQYVECHGFY